MSICPKNIFLLPSFYNYLDLAYTHTFIHPSLRVFLRRISSEHDAKIQCVSSGWLQHQLFSIFKIFSVFFSSSSSQLLPSYTCIFFQYLWLSVCMCVGARQFEADYSASRSGTSRKIGYATIRHPSAHQTKTPHRAKNKWRKKNYFLEKHLWLNSSARVNFNVFVMIENYFLSSWSATLLLLEEEELMRCDDEAARYCWRQNGK